jgi:ABC-type branched-subunit amino acid transport system substrate-binding protein
MTPNRRIARTRLASGRFLFPVWPVLPVLALLGCQIAGPGSGAEPASPPAFPDPVLVEGTMSPAASGRAAEMYAAAERALGEGRADEAREIAARIVDDYAAAPVSGRALFLLARACLEDGAPQTADEAAGRFAELLAEGDPRAAEARLVQAEARARQGDEAGRLDRLLRIGREAPTNLVLRASDEARDAAGGLDIQRLGGVLDRTPRDAVLRPVALTIYALALSRSGEGDRARSVARDALDGGARGTDSLTAVAILEGRSVAGYERVGRGRPLEIASVLPTGGSPGFREFAGLIAEGVEVAAATYLDGAPEVRVDARDDGGDPSVAASVVEALEGSGALGAIGFLEAGSLDAAARVRRSPFPLISPTARTASVEGAYTLSGADPLAAAAMARYAERAGFVRVAVIHSRAPESIEEANAFVSALEETAVALAGRFAYDAGATYFAEPIRAARAALRADEIRSLGLGPDDTLHVELLEPVAVFLPIPPEDVELVAPQVTFFGLDTLAIRTLGTSGWTDAQTLEAVDQRHTTGVVATAPANAGTGSAGHARFREAYEGHFRRSLVSPMPALGYDAAILLLEAARGGARTPAEVHAALERIRNLEGATGTFSVVDGRVVRRTHVVQIEHGTLIPAG